MSEPRQHRERETPLMRLRLLAPNILIFFATMAASAYTACAFAEDDAIHFTGRIVLSHDLYTLTGTRLEKGTCKLQVRSENGGYWLSFWRNGQQTVELEGQVPEKNAEPPAGIPMFGTLRMVPDKSLVRGGGGGRRAGDRWFGKDRSWQAAMRTYKLAGTNSRDVLFVFQAHVAPEQWRRVEFLLLTSAESL